MSARPRRGVLSFDDQLVVSLLRSDVVLLANALLSPTPLVARRLDCARRDALSPPVKADLRRVSARLELHPEEVEDLSPPLHLAASLATEEVVSLLLAAGADPEVVDVEQGLSALHCLSRRTEALDVLLPLAETLVAAGTPLERHEGYYGATALCYGAWRGNAGACAALLAVGADRDCDDAHGGSPLIWAVQNGHKACARVLREAPPREGPAEPPSQAQRAAFRRSLQERHAPRLESDARCAAAWQLKLIAAAFEETTGMQLPGEAAVLLAAKLMDSLFVLWEPVTRPTLPV
jgi:hypothetical protein